MEYKDYVAQRGSDQSIQNSPLAGLCDTEQEQNKVQILSLQQFMTDDAWKVWVDDLAELPLEQQKQRAQDIEYCFAQARKFCLLQATGALDHIPVSDRLACSIRALCLLLGEVADKRPELFSLKLGGDIGTETWGLSPLITSRMGLAVIPQSAQGNPTDPFERLMLSTSRSDWCPNDVGRMSRFLPETAMYYMSTVRGGASLHAIPGMTGGQNEASLDHSRCTEESCCADNIDSNTYITEHFPGCDGVDCGFVGPDMEKVEEILRRGKIPLIRFGSCNPSDGLFTGLGNMQELDFVEAVSLPGKQSYAKILAAVPDVPTIGLENLFECRKLKTPEWKLEVIEFDPAESESSTPFVAISHVWSDGMGNVRGNSLPKCRLPFLQRAIWQCRAPIKMNRGRPGDTTLKSYSLLIDDDEASGLASQAILPFWLDTFCVPKTSGDAKTTALRLMGKTYASASKVLVLDGRFCSPSLGGHGFEIAIESHSYMDCVARIIGSKWMRRLWTLQEGLLASELLFMFKEGPLDVRNIISGIKAYSTELVPGYLVARQLARSLEQMLEFGEARNDAYERLLRVWNLSVGRTASKPGDAALCLASSIGLDAGDLHKASETRSRLFFSMLDTVPQSIVFNDAEKLSDVGFRWADRKLAKVLMDAHSPRAKIMNSPPSLEVNFPAYIAQLTLANGDGAPSTTEYDLQDDQGQHLILTLNSDFLSPSPNEETSYILLMEKECLFSDAEVTRSRKVLVLTKLDSGKDNVPSGNIVGFGIVALKQDSCSSGCAILRRLENNTWRIL